MLENGAFCWLASSYGSNHLHAMMPLGRSMVYSANSAMGIRILVTLKAGLGVDASSGDGSVDNPWKLTQ